MKQILSLAALALVISIGGEAQAACVATNCAIDEQLKTSPSAGASVGADEAITPQLAKDLKDLSNATIHAMEAEAGHAPEQRAGTPSPETKH